MSWLFKVHILLISGVLAIFFLSLFIEACSSPAVAGFVNGVSYVAEFLYGFWVGTVTRAKS